MAEEVKADYDGLERIASIFGNEGEAVANMLQAVRGGMDNLEGNWVGRGSEAFFSEMQSEVMPASQRLQEALEEARAVTQKIAQIMGDAEDDACSPFRSS